MFKPKYFKFKSILKLFSVVILLISAVAIIIIHILGNFYQVNDGVYRSGQLNKYNLEYYVQQCEIKTIINLRGKSNKEVYNDEINISNKYNIKHIDYKLSNKKFLDFNKTSEIVQILKDAKKPFLIHCAGGADRTSLVAALYQYEIANKSIDEAKEEFSIIYGHTPFFRKYVIAMDNSFDNYTKNKIKLIKNKE